MLNFVCCADLFVGKYLEYSIRASSLEEGEWLCRLWIEGRVSLKKGKRRSAKLRCSYKQTTAPETQLVKVLFYKKDIVRRKVYVEHSTYAVLLQLLWQTNSRHNKAIIKGYSSKRKEWVVRMVCGGSSFGYASQESSRVACRGQKNSIQQQ